MKTKFTVGLLVLFFVLKAKGQAINSNEHELQLPLQELATGVYIVKIRTSESIILTTKLIISK